MKNKIPIGLRKEINNAHKDSGGLFITEFQEDFLVRFKDSDINSDFFFLVSTTNTENVHREITYSIHYKPYSEETLEVRKTVTTLKDFSKHFNKWKSLLIEANKVNDLFNDPFVQSYYEDIEPHFEIIDQDAHIKPFSIDNQLRLIKFLDSAKTTIENNTKTKDDLDSRKTIQLIEETKSNLNKLTKAKVIKRIREIIARGFKLTIEVGQKLLVEFTAELAKKILLQ